MNKSEKVFSAMINVCVACGHPMVWHADKVRLPSFEYDFRWTCQVGDCQCTEIGTWTISEADGYVRQPRRFAVVEDACIPDTEIQTSQADETSNGSSEGSLRTVESSTRVE